MAVLLVHGAWQGSWAWERLTPLLLEAGLDVHLLDLPGNGSDDTEPADVSLELYVAAVMRRVTAIKGSVSIVAHSGAGLCGFASRRSLCGTDRQLGLHRRNDAAGWRFIR